MNTKKALFTIIQDFDLNKTRFYQAWSSGTLTKKALEVYANEYGNFIGQLSLGWTTLGDKKQSDIEDRHFELWKNDFCRALHVSIEKTTLGAIKNLLDSAETMFSNKTEALGALYIFIAQQASTSQSKLEGMRKHYNMPFYSESYFHEHLGSDALAEKLLGMIEVLSPEEQIEVVGAARIFAEKIYLALESIYDAYSDTSCHV